MLLLFFLFFDAVESNVKFDFNIFGPHRKAGKIPYPRDIEKIISHYIVGTLYPKDSLYL